MNMKVTQREERKKSFLPIFIYLFFFGVRDVTHVVGQNMNVWMLQCFSSENTMS